MTDKPPMPEPGAETLNEADIYAIRGRWTARSASPAGDVRALADQLFDAQRDIAMLLRHLDAYKGPPIIGE